MTQLQLQNLIVNSLGPIIDQAIRVAGPHHASLDTAGLHNLTHIERLRRYIDVARNNGDLPAAGTTPNTGDADHPDSAWTTIVNA